MTLQTERVQTLADVGAVIDGNDRLDYQFTDREAAYEFIRRTLVRFDYPTLSKPDKGVIGRYLAKMTGLSRAQMTRLVGQHRATGRVTDRRGGAPVRPFERRYTGADIRVLAEVDAALGDMSGPATRAVMRREFEVFGQRRFERLARLSNGHLYNLRRSRTYQRKRTTFTKTRPTPVAIGERRKPRPDGQPGFLRVDTVHRFPHPRLVRHVRVPGDPVFRAHLAHGGSSSLTKYRFRSASVTGALAYTGCSASSVGGQWVTTTSTHPACSRIACVSRRWVCMWRRTVQAPPSLCGARKSVMQCPITAAGVRSVSPQSPECSASPGHTL